MPTLTLDEVLARQQAGAVVLDARDDEAFAAGHLRGSINVGLGGRFAEYAGEVMRPDTPIVLVTAPGHESEAKVRLARIGFDDVVGALGQPDRDASSLIPSTSIASRASPPTPSRHASPSCPTSC